MEAERDKKTSKQHQMLLKVESCRWGGGGVEFPVLSDKNGSPW